MLTVEEALTEAGKIWNSRSVGYESYNKPMVLVLLAMMLIKEDKEIGLQF